MNIENSKTNESKNLFISLLTNLILKTPNNKNIGLADLNIYYTWENMKSAYNNSKFKISAPTLES